MLMFQDKKGNRIEEIFDDSHSNSVRHISSHLRPEDFDEVFDAVGVSPHIIIEESWDMALRRWLIFDRNNCAVGITGVRAEKPYSNKGVVWLLGTPGLDKINRFFLSISKPIIEEMKKGFDMIYGYVDSRYDKSKRWLGWCGFTIDEDNLFFGVSDVPFHLFYMRS